MMKLPMICCVLLLAILYTGEVKGQTPLNKAEVTAILSAISPGQSVRFSPRPGKGWQLSGSEGTGSIVPYGSSWKISYGKISSALIVPDGKGWKVAGNGQSIYISSSSSNRAKFSDGDKNSGTISPWGNGLKVQQSGQTSTTVQQSDKGWSKQGDH